MKYCVICAWSDYDCGAPCASLVGGKLYSSWEKAYVAMVDDICQTMEVDALEDLGEKGYDFDVPEKKDKEGHTHKCGTAWVNSDDGEYIWNIEKCDPDQKGNK